MVRGRGVEQFQTAVFDHFGEVMDAQGFLGSAEQFGQIAWRKIVFGAYVQNDTLHLKTWSARSGAYGGRLYMKIRIDQRIGQARKL